MRPFSLQQPRTVADAIELGARSNRADMNNAPLFDAPQFIAGGTTLLDLMKLDVMRPGVLVDINALGVEGMDTISVSSEGLRLGAMVKMADACRHQAVLLQYPVLAQTLVLAASAQLRNMASLGGNVLQRTRCAYFRDATYEACNKRTPGSGCSAVGGVNHSHAVLGASDACIATYPGDFATALIALDANVDIVGQAGRRSIAFAQLHRPPGQTPHIETSLAPGDVIIAFEIPATAFASRSRYVKVRDRQSYEFATASAAVVLDIDQGKVREARIALGGVATTPWRARDAEASLKGVVLTEASAAAAADLAFGAARSQGMNAFKIPLGKATLVRALLETAAMEA